jgi:pilus assembly protein Flp/PilA
MSAATEIRLDRPPAVAKALNLIRQLLRDDRGQDLIEYALIFTFVALGAIASLKSISAGVAAVFGTVGTTLTNAT